MEKIIEGEHYRLLEQWVEDESIVLPEGMGDYVKQLEYARGFLYSSSSPNIAARKLLIHWPELSVKQTKSRVRDAVEYFYIDGDLKKDAYRQIHYEKQMAAAQLVLETAKCAADIKIASEIWERAGKSKQLHLPDAEEFPKEMFKQKWKIYSLDTSDVGLPELADRNQLGAMIDTFNITEAEKIRLKQDAGVEPREILDFNGQKESAPEE
jgi:hypothetical protein